MAQVVNLLSYSPSDAEFYVLVFIQSVFAILRNTGRWLQLAAWLYKAVGKEFSEDDLKKERTALALKCTSQNFGGCPRWQHIRAVP